MGQRTQFSVPSDSGGKVIARRVELPTEGNITGGAVTGVYEGKRFEPQSSDRLGGTVPGELGF